MLDTSDKALFVSGYDPAMGTTGYIIDVDDTVAISLVFDASRRGAIITNAGPKICYFSLTAEVSTQHYSFKLRPTAFCTINDYGGIVTAICNPGESTELYVTIMK